jgi:GntR family transcriptional regulator
MSPRRPRAATGARLLDRAAPAPLWAQLHADLLRRLDDDEFGQVLPGELTLAAQYDVSRHTVREAMRRLRADGVLHGDRGQAARPPATPAPSASTLYSLSAVAERAGVVQWPVVRALDIRTDVEVAARLGLGPAAPLVYLERLRVAADAPLALERSWMPAVLAAGLLEVDFSHASLYEELARIGIHPWGGAEYLTAVVPSPEERRILGIGTGVAAFSVERQACAGGRFFEIRRTLVRGDRVQVYAEFTDRAGYQLNLTGTAHDTAGPIGLARLSGRPARPGEGPAAGP